MELTNTKTLYALMVGIDNYPNPSHRLKGCWRDVIQMRKYLYSFCNKNNFQLKELLLRDSEASRAGIIEGFNHFNDATEEDICLFFYAGHGSRVKSPREFLHLEADGYIASLVCHDSRTYDGRDLMDKELSWLITKATKGKEKLQFISIMDCCHSGRITRTKDIQEDEILVRTLDELEDIPEVILIVP